MPIEAAILKMPSVKKFRDWIKWGIYDGDFELLLDNADNVNIDQTCSHLSRIYTAYYIKIIRNKNLFPKGVLYI